MTCCRLFGLRRVVHAPCNAIVYEDNGEMSMSDPALFQPKAPLLPISLVVVFATAIATASWGLGFVGQVLQRGGVPSSNTATSRRCKVFSTDEGNSMISP